jgi:chlorobactene glucosyltransferase
MRNYQTLPEIVPVSTDETIGAEDVPAVSIIVPARNEEANIARLLTSLMHQDYPRYEVIVVNDASTDNTAAIVQAYEGVRLIPIDGPPEGWTGKNYACWIGAGYARSPWLLFVDADTELATSALRSTIHFAVKQHIKALSLFPQQRCETFWERLLLPFAYQQYFVGTDARVNERNGPALANGQYFFIHHTAYELVNGHAANAGSIVDDAALAISLKRKGIISLACRGEELVSVRMYTNVQQIANGFGKNIYPYLHQSPLTGIQTAFSTILASAVAFLFIDARREKSYPLFLIAVLAYMTQVMSALPWFKHFGIMRRYALLTPFAALAFLAIAINSLLHTIVGRSVAWKGRSYAMRKKHLVPTRDYSTMNDVRSSESRLVERY